MVMVVGKIAVSVVARRSLSGRHRWGLGLCIYPDNYCRILLLNDISKKKEIKNIFLVKKFFFFSIERGSKLAAV